MQMKTQVSYDHRHNDLYADLNITTIPTCTHHHNELYANVNTTIIRPQLANTILLNAFHVTLTMKMSKFIRLTFLWVHGKNEVTQYSRRRYICLRLFLESIDLSCHVIFVELQPLFKRGIKVLLTMRENIIYLNNWIDFGSAIHHFKSQCT